MIIIKFINLFFEFEFFYLLINIKFIIKLIYNIINIYIN